MTERLYYRDATLFEFDATILAHDGAPTRVILDRTAFYPTSGGQPHDTGMLNGVPVVDVIDDETRVIHVTASPLPTGAAHGRVDPVRRLDHMQQHTAQHLLSALAADRLGWETTSVHFGATHSTIEFATATASAGQLHDLEQWANAAVAAAYPVRVTFEEGATAAGLRKPTARKGEIRVVSIASLDRSACGGTHLSSTAEIGAVALDGVERIRGQVRVGFLAGARVLARLHTHEALIARVADELACAPADLTTVAPKRQADLKLQRERIEALEREVAAARVQALIDGAAPGTDGVRWIIHQVEEESSSLLRAMAQAVGSLERVVLVITTASPPAILVGASADSGCDAGSTLKRALAAGGGRGGGSPRMAQGTAPSPAALAAVVAALGAT